MYTNLQLEMQPSLKVYKITRSCSVLLLSKNYESQHKTTQPVLFELLQLLLGVEDPQGRLGDVELHDKMKADPLQQQGHLGCWTSTLADACLMPHLLRRHNDWTALYTRSTVQTKAGAGCSNL